MRRDPGRSGETFGLVLILALAGAFYFWTATSAGSPLTFERTPDDLYNRLADAFLAGQTSFLEEPPSELARLANPYDPAQNAPYKKYHDVTYYRGRYYLYFGPVPALVLLVPWKVLTGASLPQNLAVVGFAWATAAMAVLLLREMRRRWFPATPGWVVLLLALGLVFGSLLPVLLRRPLFYELAISSACFFGLTALWLLLKASAGDRYRWVALAGAGLCLGLAVGSRPNCLFGAAAAIGLCLWQWRREAPFRRAAALLLPFAACGLALMGYNYARFGSVMELGTSYMFLGTSHDGVPALSLRYVPINLYNYLAAAARFSVYFPFVEAPVPAPFPPPPDYSWHEHVYGIAVTLPLLWALGWVGWGLRPAAAIRPWQPWARIATGFAIANAAFLLLMMGALNRYLLDFVPVLMVLACVGVLHIESATVVAWHRRLLRAGWIAALLATILFNVFASFAHQELLRFKNPATYQRLAHPFNRWSPVWQGLTGRPSGPLRIELLLPAHRSGQVEPLVVTGLSLRADFLYVRYLDGRRIQFGFSHADRGGPVGPPVEVEEGVPHVIEVEMGSLYPPVFHPFFDGWTSEDITRRKRTLLVKLDGREVLAAQAPFFDASPGDVSVGQNPESEAFGRRFTGRILRVERTGAR